MSFKGSNPKMVAKEIADGYVMLTMANIRRYNHAQLKILNQNMIMVEREFRSERLEVGDTDNIKKKQMRLQRLYRAKTLIQTYAKKWKIQI